MIVKDPGFSHRGLLQLPDEKKKQRIRKEKKMETVIMTCFPNQVNLVGLCLEYVSSSFCEVCKTLFPKSIGCRHQCPIIDYKLQGSVKIVNSQVVCTCENDAEVLEYLNVHGTMHNTEFTFTHLVSHDDALFLENNQKCKIKLQKKLKFIHITKTGGSSIEQWGVKRGLTWGCEHPEYGAWSRARAEHGKWHTFFHLQPETLKMKYDWFVIVRNPYNRILSETYCPFAGRDRPRRNPDEVIAKQQFNDYIQRKINSRWAEGDHYSEQHLYVTPRVHVIHFESLIEEFAILMKQYNLPNNLDIHVQKGTGLREVKFTIDDFSVITMELIHQVYAKDFELFGYSQRII